MVKNQKELNLFKKLKMEISTYENLLAMNKHIMKEKLPKNKDSKEKLHEGSMANLRNRIRSDNQNFNWDNQGRLKWDNPDTLKWESLLCH